jgi:hypothetical protein
MGTHFHGVIEVGRDSRFLRHEFFAYVTWPAHRELFAVLVDSGSPKGVPKRGFPRAPSFATQITYGVEVVPDTLNEPYSEWATMREADAMEYLLAGESHFLESRGVWISHPSHKHVNWITRAELLSACTGVESTLGAEYKATVTALERLETEGLVCRLVYWFVVGPRI